MDSSVCSEDSKEVTEGKVVRMGTWADYKGPLAHRRTQFLLESEEATGGTGR